MANVMDNPKYSIVRVWRNSGRKRVMRRGLSLADAKIHCSRPDTKGKTWMDVFYQENVSD